MTLHLQLARFRGFIGARLAAFAALALVALAAQAQESLKVGVLYALTGPAGSIGTPEERGLRLRVDELNKAGGVNGKRVELIVYDTEGNGTKAAQLIRRLIESDKVHVIFGPSTSGESLLVAPIANELKVPLLAHAGSEKVATPVTPFVFNTPPSDRIAATHLLSVFRKKGIAQIGLLASADAFGQSGTAVLNELAPKFGVQVVRHEEFNRQDADITSQVLRMKNSTAQAILIWSVLPAPTVIMKTAVDVGLGKPIYNSYAVASTALLVQTGPAANGTFVSSMRILAPETVRTDDPVRPVVLKVFNDYKARYKETPPVYAANGYDAMLIVEAAVKAVKGELTPQKLRDAMEQVTVVGANGIYRFSPQSHALDVQSESMVLMVAQGGEWKLAE